tara:strand:+ start:1229 stop:1486 length:258 start_codon:yes stop_codon:yes gene_type:complete
MLVAVVLVGNALVGERGLVAMVRATDKSEALEKIIVQLREENEWLREDMRQLREEKNTIEKLAREELGLIQPGEKLFIIKNTSKY